MLTVELWLSFLYGSYNGAMVVALTEVVPVEVRTAGFSLAYSLATTLGGFARHLDLAHSAHRRQGRARLLAELRRALRPRRDAGALPRAGGRTGGRQQARQRLRRRLARATAPGNLPRLRSLELTLRQGSGPGSAAHRAAPAVAPAGTDTRVLGLVDCVSEIGGVRSFPPCGGRWRCEATTDEGSGARATACCAQCAIFSSTHGGKMVSRSKAAACAATPHPAGCAGHLLPQGEKLRPFDPADAGHYGMASFLVLNSWS